jgi:excisionase family DNA binding protein
VQLDETVKNFYRLDEVAKILDVSRRTIERSIKDGSIHSFKVRDTRRISAKEIERLQKQVDDDIDQKE